MTSIPAAIISGSYQSASNVRDAWVSYRRTQTHHSDFVSGSRSCSPAPSGVLHDPEAAYPDEDDFEQEWQSRLSREQSRRRALPDDAILQNVEWDDDLSPEPSTQPRRYHFRPDIPRHVLPLDSEDDDIDVMNPRANFDPTEHTPLLVRPPSRVSLSRPAVDDPQHLTIPYAALQRKISLTSVLSSTSNEVKYQYGGQSTFSQTLINAVGVLLGIGLLSQPFAFACAGWILGTILIIGYGIVSCYTAKILARIVLENPHIRSYADISRKVFGPRSVPVISLLFGLELFTVSVALVTLYGDSLHTVIPTYSSDTFKILGLAILIPAVLMPLSVLSFASIIGIFSLMAVIGIIVFDGFTKVDSPGSLWSPAATSLGIDNYRELGIAFGLFMAGFAGHAVIPTLARDMADTSRFDEMINWAFVLATSIYVLLGIVGYLMFGNAVSDEFSLDLMKYNAHPALNSIALWGLVITPLSKYALTARPLNITIEILLGIDGAFEVAVDVTRTASQRVKAVLVAIERIVLALAAVSVSILVPEFASVMAVLGATFSFLMCVIGPLCAKITLNGGIRKCEWKDAALLAVTAAMAVWGSICAFESATTGEGV
ncbi:transmembrane amino acid transporter protein-domain-containing protein [Ganoderma leucocontextum]|nr:transmembrane amino acid transporter protein-domain-containing protein [Ganoderma leucocontextum]